MSDTALWLVVSPTVGTFHLMAFHGTSTNAHVFYIHMRRE